MKSIIKELLKQETQLDELLLDVTANKKEIETILAERTSLAWDMEEIGRYIQAKEMLYNDNNKHYPFEKDRITIDKAIRV